MKATALRFFALFFLVAFVRPFAAQEVEAWFSRPGESGAYASLKQELIALASSERAAILTDRPLVLRLIEGARKGVGAAKLAEILKDETAQLISAAAVLRARGLLPADKESANKLFLQLDLALRAGFEVADFSAALEGSIVKSGRNAAAPARAVSVLAAMAGMKIDKKDRAEFIAAIASGPLPDSRLSSVRSSYADLVMKGASSDDSLKSLRESLGPARLQAGDGPPARQQEPPLKERSGPVPGPGPGAGPGMGGQMPPPAPGPAPASGGGQKPGRP